MTSNGKGPASVPAPVDLTTLRAWRTDYEDVPVESLGGNVVRLYAISGTARAHLIPQMANLVGLTDEQVAERGEDAARRVLEFQTHVVAASLGFPFAEWDAAGDALGVPTIEALYPLALEVSKMGKEAVDEEEASLGEATSVGSGTG